MSSNAAAPWGERSARAAYSALMALASLPLRAKLAWRARREPLYGHAIGERFGRYTTNDAAARGGVWVHAVSLGETRAAASLVEALREELPGMRLLLTHGTATGRDAGSALLRDGDAQVWLPHDARGAVARFLDRFAPRIGVLVETEVWPTLLHAAHERGIAMVLANARLSERSLRRARRLDALMRPAVRSLALALAQTDADAERLRAAGAREVEVLGNLKFDMTPDAALLTQGHTWRQALRPRAVLLAASTREGEEAALLDAWRSVPAAGRPLLLLVPRHPQRFDEVLSLVEARGLAALRRSAFGDAPPAGARDADVWLGDSLGEMPMYYALGDIALLGGSFAPFGGQNLIEAAACGCPVVAGPHTFNFADATERSIAAGAARRATSIDDAIGQALAVVGYAPAREAMARAALDFAAAHRGAARRMAERIASLAR